MLFEQIDPMRDEAALRTCHQIVISGQSEDDPGSPPFSYRMFSGWWKYGLSGEPRETWLATGADGEPVGCYQLDLPDQENRESAFLYPSVAMTARRRGVGTALLAHVAQRAQLAGRKLLSSDARVGSPGEAFARAIGAKAGLLDARRVVDLTPELLARLPGLRASAEPHAAGYTLRYWTGTSPEDLIGQICGLEDAMEDAPHEDWVEPISWDVERVRIADKRLVAQDLRQYSIAAMHDASGEMAALTQLMIDPAVDVWAFQGMTAVVRQHRGHRLGMLLKVAMLEQAAQREPGVRRIMTFNSVQNDHMIAVNDELGHRVTDYFQNFELEVPALLHRLSARAPARHGA